MYLQAPNEAVLIFCIPMAVIEIVGPRSAPAGRSAPIPAMKRAEPWPVLAGA